MRHIYLNQGEPDIKVYGTGLLQLLRIASDLGFSIVGNGEDFWAKNNDLCSIGYILRWDQGVTRVTRSISNPRTILLCGIIFYCTNEWRKRREIFDLYRKHVFFEEMGLMVVRFLKKGWDRGSRKYFRNDRKWFLHRIVEVLGHSHNVLKSSELKFPQKNDFFAKFRLKIVSRIFWGMSSLSNLFSFYGGIIHKRSSGIESIPNLITFPEIAQPCVKSAHFYHLRNQLWRHRTLWYDRSGHLIRKIRTQTISTQ